MPWNQAFRAPVSSRFLEHPCTARATVPTPMPGCSEMSLYTRVAFVFGLMALFRASPLHVQTIVTVETGKLQGVRRTKSPISKTFHRCLQWGICAGVHRSCRKVERESDPPRSSGLTACNCSSYQFSLRFLLRVPVSVNDMKCPLRTCCLMYVFCNVSQLISEARFGEASFEEEKTDALLSTNTTR